MLVAIAVSKIAIVTFITEIEGTTLKTYRKCMLWGPVILNTLFTIAIVPLIWLQCDPIPKLWNDEIAGACNGRQRNQEFAYLQGSMYPYSLSRLMN